MQAANRRKYCVMFMFVTITEDQASKNSRIIEIIQSDVSIPLCSKEIPRYNRRPYYYCRPWQ